jgi:uncharacterized membrane protein YsdA (DUF1294 family)
MTGWGVLLHNAAGYLIVLNLLGFGIMGYDKRKAKQHGYRVSEATLFTVAAIGGSIGSLLGMVLFRHKTKHIKFTIGMPLILLAQFGIAAYMVSIYQTR